VKDNKDLFEYTVRIRNEQDNKHNGIFVHGNFGEDEYFFFHEGDTMLTIEMDTKNENTIAEALRICKKISSEFSKLNELVAALY